MDGAIVIKRITEANITKEGRTASIVKYIVHLSGLYQWRPIIISCPSLGRVCSPITRRLEIHYIIYRTPGGRYVPFTAEHVALSKSTRSLAVEAKWLYPPLSYYWHLCASHDTIVAIIAPVVLSWMSVNSYYCALRSCLLHCRLSFHNRLSLRR